MGWPPFGPDDRRACPTWRAGALERAGGDATVLAHCGMSLLQGAREYDWGMAVLQSAATPIRTTRGGGSRPRVAHLHCGDLDQALALFHRADRLEPGRQGGARLADRHRPRAHGPRQLRRGARLGDALAGGQPDLRPAPSGCWSRPTPISAAWTRRAATRGTPAAGARGDRRRASAPGSAPRTPAGSSRSSTGCGWPGCRRNSASRRVPCEPGADRIFATLWNFSPAAEGHESRPCGDPR